MDSRAGAVSEGLRSRADAADVDAHRDTSADVHNDDLPTGAELAQSSRVAELPFGPQEDDENRVVKRPRNRHAKQVWLTRKVEPPPCRAAPKEESNNAPDFIGEKLEWLPRDGTNRRPLRIFRPPARCLRSAVVRLITEGASVSYYESRVVRRWSPSTQVWGNR